MSYHEREKNYSVLLVEDDPVISYQFKKSLAEDLKFPAHVDHVPSAQEALHLLQKQRYHLLLIEAELQNQIWQQLLEKIQELGIQLPIILMIASADEAFIERAQKMGIADLIVKSEHQLVEIGPKLLSFLEKFKKTQTAQAGQTRNTRRKNTHPKAAGGRRKDDWPIPEASKETRRMIQDELTGLYSHSYLHDRISKEVAHALEFEYPISCLMIDIDHFKSVNEKWGHRFGDQLLHECACMIMQNCRLSDFVARYGGEEFAVVLPHTDYQGAQDLALRLRNVFAEHRFIVGEQEINVTVSMGVSSFKEDNMKVAAELMSFANQALYRSKAQGRNCVTMFKEVTPTFADGFPALKISEDKIVEFQRRMTEISNNARRGYIDASKALIMALESKDRYTAGHAASCAKYSLQVAEALGMSLEEAEIVQHAALLHDIGKICIPDTVLLKPGKLSFTEYETMKQHPYLGYKILKPIRFLQQEAILVLHHHEWVNGEGYPCRLKGNEIPMGARIISVIDSYDTMRIAGGRYKKTSTVESSVNELITCSGVQFDPFVVKAFIEVLKKRGELSGDEVQHDRLEEIIKTYRY